MPKHVERFTKAVRSHWGIDNRLHRMAEVEFSENATRINKVRIACFD